PQGLPRVRGRAPPRGLERVAHLPDLAGSPEGRPHAIARTPTARRILAQDPCDYAVQGPEHSRNGTWPKKGSRAVRLPSTACHGRGGGRGCALRAAIARSPIRERAGARSA